MLFGLFENIWTERVLAIAYSAKIGIVSYLSLLQGSKLYVPYYKDMIFYVKIEGFKSNDPDWISQTHTSCSLIYFDNFFMIASPGKTQFIFQIINIAHKIRYH